jgi:hypothetical protein
MRACCMKFWLEDIIGKEDVAEYYFVVLSLSWTVWY